MESKFKGAVFMFVAFAAGGAVQAQMTSVSYGYCTQPFAPSAYLSKPSKPFCATMRNCSDWEVRSYRYEVDRYYANLRRYAGEVDDYYEEAISYIRCMQDLD